MIGQNYKILIVDDDEFMLELLKESVTTFGHTLTTSCATGKDALHIIGEESPDIVLMDIKLEGEIDGIQAAMEINKLHDIPIIFISGYDDRDTIENVLPVMPAGFLVKPIDVRELKINLDLAIVKHKTLMDKEKLVAELTDAFSNIIRNYTQSVNFEIDPHWWFK